MNNGEYWRKRSEIREARAYSNCLEATNGLVNAYRDTAANIRGEINDFYNRFATENGMDYADAVKFLNRDEALEWRTSVGGYIEEIRREKDPAVRERLMQEYDARAYGSRITRLESLNGSIDTELSRLYARANEQFRQLLGENYTDGYYQAIYDIQSRYGYSSAFATVNSKVVENALTYPWSGANFSDRLWKHKFELLNQLRETLTTGLIRGESVQDMSKRLAERMNASRSNALRLIRTESSHIHNTAELDAYKACGFEEYEYMASFGERTCDVCGGLDGRRFKLSDKQPGVNFPPLHPNCRCTTIAVDPDDDLEDLKSGELDYEQWYQKYVGGRAPEKLEYREGAETAVPRGQPVPVMPGGARNSAPLKSAELNPVNGVDVKDLYDKIATPGKGNVTYGTGFNPKYYPDEVSFANWLLNTLGGDVEILAETKTSKMADYIWNGKLWDLKTATTEKSSNGLIRKGLKQIADNPGGIFLDYGNNEISLDVLTDCINKRMQWCHGVKADIMVIQNGKVTKVFRYKK